MYIKYSTTKLFIYFDFHITHIKVEEQSGGAHGRDREGMFGSSEEGVMEQGKPENL